ncbi:MAG: universal stress protein [Gemmatales bacterium]|nr:universal stress protein [Gemmatales bacterium]MDW8385886.1 universal stress protein [Gemmatales bacterium]
MFSVERILVPTDFSASSDDAFQVAKALARDYKARLVVLHVAPPMIVVFGEGVLPPEPTPHPEKIKERLRQVYAAEPPVEAEYRLVEGEAAPEILRIADEVAADLIVMGTHGRTGLTRMLMGSVAEEVVRKAKCPVLTVKSQPRPASIAEGI